VSCAACSPTSSAAHGKLHQSPQAAEPVIDPTFHEFAELWWVERERELRPATRADYRWRLENHLIPFFGQHTLPQITIAEVDRYKATKLAEGTLGPRSINMTLTLLGALLAAAAERELVDRNVAKGKRRVRGTKPRRSYLGTAQQITALLDAAGDMDAESRADRQHVHRRDLLAVLVFGGLRIGELLNLRWRDVDSPLDGSTWERPRPTRDAGTSGCGPCCATCWRRSRPAHPTPARRRLCSPWRAGRRRAPATCATGSSRRR
jgi:integrase